MAEVPNLALFYYLIELADHFLDFDAINKLFVLI